MHFTSIPQKHFLFHQDLRLDMEKEVQPLEGQQVCLTVHLPCAAEI